MKKVDAEQARKWAADREERLTLRLESLRNAAAKITGRRDGRLARRLVWWTIVFATVGAVVRQGWAGVTRDWQSLENWREYTGSLDASRTEVFYDLTIVGFRDGSRHYYDPKPEQQ